MILFIDMMKETSKQEISRKTIILMSSVFPKTTTRRLKWVRWVEEVEAEEDLGYLVLKKDQQKSGV
jgi:hypothetical protein